MICLSNSPGIYLASFTAYHSDYNIVYQDILGNRDIGGDMMDIDLNNYSFVIATPPCNYYSRANYRRDISEYSAKTRHLLPDILNILSKSNKPFIVENVRNKKMFSKLGLFDLPGVYVYFIGRHTYWTNIPLSDFQVKYLNDSQKPIVITVNGKKKYLSSQNLSGKYRQGGKEVHAVIEIWLHNLFWKDSQK